ncbi:MULTISPECIES: serine protease [Nostoc]|uniref:Tetratricopeptide repeat protein n=1 Tax=Nostoc paludosum FACHB-159 TaxID=2692908 RepID=A0ABR8KIW3_9NOSO|nr:MULTISPECIES: serine protease [Nostoc]MBD2679413.1 tetratricopeptide repeat protein [Nostoc sp. FACHB-857]MBD2738738.1 tetratricopeptide repeat protein [Nostoc paludosum FACHB-159]
MKSFNLAINASLSGLLIAFNPHIAKSQQILNYESSQNPDNPSSNVIAKQIQNLRKLSFTVPIRTLLEVAPNLEILPKEWQNQQQAQRPGAGNTVIDKVDNIAQQITVRIDSKNHGNGSGVIIAKQGNTYYVATARHVVQKPDNYEITAPDGKRYLLQPEDIFQPEGIDVALVKFTSNETYAIATISTYNLSFISSSSYEDTVWLIVSGFPVSDRGKRRSSPGFLHIAEALLFRAESNYLSQSLVEGGYRLAYSNLSLPGMSGGPVLNVKGQVIGINAGVETPRLKQIQIGFTYGVPSSSILRLATKAGLGNLLKVDNNKPPSISNSELALLTDHPLVTIKRPSADANEYDWLEYANQLWRLKRYSETIAVLQKIVRYKPDFSEVYYALGLVLGEGGGEPEKSLIALDLAIKLRPDYYEAWKFKSIVLTNLKRYSLAVAAIDKAIEYNDSDLGLYYQRASILFKLQRYPEALATLDKAIEIQPLSFLYGFRGVIGFYLQDYKGIVADMNQAIKLQPDFAVAYVMRSTGRFFLNDIYGGVADFRLGVRLSLKDNQGKLPDYINQIVKKPKDAPDYVLRGIVRFELKDYQGALADYSKAIKLQNNSPIAYVERGNIYVELKDYQAALADYNQAIKLSPNNASTYRRRGNVYVRLEDYPAALADFNQAIKLNPNSASTYSARSDVYVQLKDYPAALADFNQIIKLNPNNASAYYWRGVVRSQMKDYQGALADYSQFIQFEPNNAIGYFVRGVVYHKQGNNNAALTEYNQALTKEPQFWEVMTNIGYIKYEKGDIAGAIQQWQQAVQINGQAAEPKLSLAVALYAIGEQQKGLDMAQSALSLDNSWSDVEILKQNLWGKTLIVEAQKLMSHPQIQALRVKQP